MAYDIRYPSVQDLKLRAKKRLPKFAFDYIDGAIDEEHGKWRNRHAWHDILLTPRYLTDIQQIDTGCTLFGHRYSLPFGVSAVGLGNMMWPGAEKALATAAQRANLPYMLSTFSTTPLETIAKVAPDVCWFQLYVPKREAVLEDILQRVAQAGFNVLVVTLDIPVGAKRNRELKNNLKLPFRVTPAMIWQAMTHPTWTLATLRAGTPDFVNVQAYRDNANQNLASFISDFTMAGVPLECIKKIRDLWKKPLVIKGIQHEANAQALLEIGVDGLQLSNHGGRQLDAAPTSVATLKQLAKLKPSTSLLVDSGLRNGIDVLRAKALGADMAFMGRPFFYSMGALGARGADHLMAIYQDEITRSLQQIGCHRFEDLDASWLA